MEKPKYPSLKNYKKPSKTETSFGVAGIIAIGIFSLWASIHLYNWYLPHPETASAIRRLGGYLFLPLWMGMFLALFLGYIALIAFIKKTLGLGPWASGSTLIDVKPEREEKRPSGPSTLPYWFMAVFFGGIFLVVLFYILQDMLIRHFPGEDWAILLFDILILGAPTTIGILRIRDIHRGVTPLTSWRATQKPMSPLAGAIVGGLFAVLLLGGGAFSAWRTTRFLQTALPAEGVVVRWVHHSSGRSGHENLVVAFTTHKRVNLVAECQETSGLEFLRPNVGEKVPVLYNPMEPADFRVNQFSELWSGPILAFLILAAVSVGLFFRFKMRAGGMRN